jgi:hypothetical protein
VEKMSANLPRPSVDENISTTLASGITDVAASMDVADGSKIVAPCYLVIDRVDSAGTLKATSLWEYIKVTNVAGNTLTITRTQGGSTGQAHSSGAIVEAVVTSSMFEDWYNAINPEHTDTGGHVISTASITNGVIDVNRVVTQLNVSGASISGLERTFVWYMPGTASGPTTNVMRLIAPFTGTFQAFTMMTRTPVSTASLNVTLFKNGNVSVFDTLTVPTLLGGGTLASTASIKTKNFTRGDTLTADIVTGGNVADITLEGIAY